MKNDLPISEQLKKKYHKVEEVQDLKEMLYRSSSIYKSRTAFKVKDKDGKIKSITYEQFKNDVVFLGTSLLKKGFKDKKIAVVGKNSYQWCVSYLAATIVGIVVPIDKELHTDDIINFMNVSEAVCILGDKKNIAPVEKNKNKLNFSDTLFVYFDKDNIENSYAKLKDEGKKLYQNGYIDFDKIEIDPDSLRILLFTSGTTGNAKGVCLSQRNICSNILSIYGIVKVKRSDLFFSILPLHHTYECTIGFLLPIYSGASIAHCEGLRYIVKNMNEFRPSVILSVPLLLENVHKNIVKNMNKSLPEKYRKENENPFPSLPWVMKKVVKNKVAPPFKTAEFDILYGEGISKEGNILDFAVENNIIKKSGAWFSYNGEKIGQGRDNVRKYMVENKEFTAEIDRQVRELLKNNSGYLPSEADNSDNTDGKQPTEAETTETTEE